MANVAEPTATRSDRISFELDRFELGDDGRVAVSGRWFGVRGRRFVRPTLTMRTDRGRCRSLADLAHKPWAAEDGEHWQAEFSVDADDTGVLEAELAVAPDIEIALPAPGDVALASRRIAAPGARGGADPARRPSHASELDGLRRELSSARDELEQARAEASAAIAERDRAADALTAAQRRSDDAERDRQTALEERDRAFEAARDATAERDHDVRSERNANAERDRRLDELTRAVAARDARLDELLRVVADRDARLAELGRAVAERDRAISERDALAASFERLRSEHAALSTARGAALAMHNSTTAGGVHRREWDWPSRGLAIVLLLVVALAVALITHVI